MGTVYGRVEHFHLSSVLSLGDDRLPWLLFMERVGFSVKTTIVGLLLL